MRTGTTLLSFTTDYSGGSPIQDWNMLVYYPRIPRTVQATPDSVTPSLIPTGRPAPVSKAGEELKYEIANWNSAGESQVWVRVPSLADDENVTMYWGNANAGLPAYANNGSTWDGYFGVYHLEGTAGSATDSSPLGNDLPGVNAPVLQEQWTIRHRLFLHQCSQQWICGGIIIQHPG